MASPSKNINPTTVSKFETTGSNTGIGSGMFLWDAKVDTKPGKLTTTGEWEVVDQTGTAPSYIGNMDLKYINPKKIMKKQMK